MLDFFLDFLIDPFLDLTLCRFDLEIWFRHRVKSFLLTVPFCLSIWLLVGGISGGSWFLIVLGAVGTLFFGWLDIRYTVWWIREGRFDVGAVQDDGILDRIRVPKGDIMSTDPKEAHLREALEDAHRCLNNRM